MSSTSVIIENLPQLSTNTKNFITSVLCYFIRPKIWDKLSVNILPTLLVRWTKFYLTPYISCDFRLNKTKNKDKSQFFLILSMYHESLTLSKI